MVYLLEKGDAPRCTLESNKRDTFTQKLFSDLIQHSHAKKNDYYIGRVQCLESSNLTYFCYDARQLCKYIFEMVISTEGRKIRIKNFKDPISRMNINEVHFFRLKYDSDAPLRAEYVGNHDNFLQSNSLRSKIFYSEDALDALSVNFEFNSVKKTRLVDKRRLFALFIMAVFTIVLLSCLLIMVEKKNGKFKVKDIKDKLKISHK